MSEITETTMPELLQVEEIASSGSDIDELSSLTDESIEEATSKSEDAGEEEEEEEDETSTEEEEEVNQKCCEN